MKYLSIESAKILNVGLIVTDLTNTCESVKNALIKKGWVFQYSFQRVKLRGETEYTINTRVRVIDGIDGNGFTFLDFWAETNDPLKEALTHIQNHYKQTKIFDKLK